MRMIRRWLVNLTSERTWQALRGLAASLAADSLRWRARALPSATEPYRLNVGCGPNHKSGWVNIDREAGADLRIDVRDGFPLPHASCATVYSEHFVEHLDYPNESAPFFEECLRVLRPGGVMHVGVPDARVVIEACFGDRVDPAFLAAAKEHDWGYPESCQTGLEFINYHFRIDGDHRFAFDEATLVAQLERAGFVDVAARGYDPSLDTESRAEGTLYVVGRKPALDRAD